MTITVYVNWSAQEIYKNDEALVEGYLDYHGGAEMYFNEYLGEAYEPDTLFYATEGKKKEILEKYNAVILENAKDWATDLCMKQEINI
jgi:hypothetical protein